MSLKESTITFSTNAFTNLPLIKKDSIESRVYQEELLNKVIEKGNTLIVAPTALGKTVIAALVSAKVLSNSVPQKNEKCGENSIACVQKKILFLSPTKPLAVQHEKSFKKFLDIPEEKIVAITGSSSPKIRKELYENSIVISSTPQTIESDFFAGRFSFKNFGLVIFDEAHRAVGDYSYVFLARQLTTQEPNAIILALTASPGSEEEKIQDVCRNLFIKNIEIKNNSDADVTPYINEIEVDWVKVDLPQSFFAIKEFFQEFQRHQLNALKTTGLIVTTNLKYYTKNRILALQGQLRAKLSQPDPDPMLYSAISRVASLLKVSHAEELIETQGIGALKNYFDKLAEEALSKKSKAAVTIMADEKMRKAFELTQKLFSDNIQHPKYEELKKIILKQFSEKPDSKILVFNHYRDSILEVVKFLSNESVIRPSKFIGQATKGNEKGMSQKEQQKALDELREGTFNVLVTSSVAEEGLDIPAVELVVFFEPVPSEIRTIQRRGRTGRFSKGKAIILMARNTRDEAFYWVAKNKERNMRSTLATMKSDSEYNSRSASYLTSNYSNTSLRSFGTHSVGGTINSFLGNGLSPTLTSNTDSKPKSSVLAPSSFSTHPATTQLSEQTILSTFDSNIVRTKPIIFVDTREASSSIGGRLIELGAEVRTKQITIGDYVLSKDICCERKTIDDFLSSIIDGRLFQQLVPLRENYPKPFIIIEGNQNELFSSRLIHRNSIIGALTSISLDYQVPIVTTKNSFETAEYLFLIAKREQLGLRKEIRLRVGKKGRVLSDKQQYLMEGFPMVGPSLAKELLKKFKTIKSIANATEKDLMSVEKLGPKKAKAIKKIIDSEYDENDKKELLDDLGDLEEPVEEDSNFTVEENSKVISENATKEKIDE